ncbi:kinase-like protein [Clavulina sp. PMI_390]|nr:kinase-like protein [Clavulina sp. PMI_390]
MTVVEFVEGGSLDNIFKERAKPLHLGRFQRIFLGISRGVEYLHSLNVVHGDLHPGNVLVERSGHPYLSDFGLSHMCYNTTTVKSLCASQEGGHYRYMAPELRQKIEQHFHTSTESDIFSLAMTFLYAWSRQKPFSDIANEEGVLTRLLNKGRPEHPKVTAPLSPLEGRGTRLWVLIEDMWAHDPAERPLSGEVVERLELVFSAETPTSEGSSQTEENSAVSGRTGEA